MASLTDFGERRALDGALGGVTTAATMYAALFTAAPGEAGGGTEVSGDGYVRQTMEFGAATTDGAGVTTAANSAEVLFPAATADWGSITHVALFDAASAGNMIWHGPLATARTILTGDQFRFAAESVVASMA